MRCAAPVVALLCAATARGQELPFPPLDPAGAWTRAVADAEAGRPLEALTWARSLEGETAEHPEAWTSLRVRLALRAGDLVGAFEEATARLAESHDPVEQVDLLELRGLALEGLGLDLRACADLRAALAVDPTRAATRGRLAGLLARLLRERLAARTPPPAPDPDLEALARATALVGAPAGRAEVPALLDRLEAARDPAVRVRAHLLRARFVRRSHQLEPSIAALDSALQVARAAGLPAAGIEADRLCALWSARQDALRSAAPGGDDPPPAPPAPAAAAPGLLAQADRLDGQAARAEARAVQAHARLRGLAALADDGAPEHDPDLEYLTLWCAAEAWSVAHDAAANLRRAAGEALAPWVETPLWTDGNYLPWVMSFEMVALRPRVAALQARAAAAEAAKQALAATAAGDDDRLLAASDAALAHPAGRSAEVLLARGLALARRGAGLEAAVCLHEAVAAAPEGTSAAQAAAALAELAEQADAWRRAGHGAQAEGDLERARRTFDAAIDVAPSSAGAWLDLARLESRRGDHAASLVSYGHVEALDAGLAVARERLHEALLTGAFARAMADIEALFLAEPWNRDLRLLRCYGYFLVGEAARQEAEYRRLQRAYPGDPRVHLSYVRHLVALGLERGPGKARALLDQVPGLLAGLDAQALAAEPELALLRALAAEDDPGPVRSLEPSGPGTAWALHRAFLLGALPEVEYLAARPTDQEAPLFAATAAFMAGQQRRRRGDPAGAPLLERCRAAASAPPTFRRLAARALGASSPRPAPDPTVPLLVPLEHATLADALAAAAPGQRIQLGPGRFSLPARLERSARIEGRAPGDAPSWEVTQLVGRVAVVGDRALRVLELRHLELADAKGPSVGPYGLLVARDVTLAAPIELERGGAVLVQRGVARGSLLAQRGGLAVLRDARWRGALTTADGGELALDRCYGHGEGRPALDAGAGARVAGRRVWLHSDTARPSAPACLRVAKGAAAALADVTFSRPVGAPALAEGPGSRVALDGFRLLGAGPAGIGAVVSGGLVEARGAATRVEWVLPAPAAVRVEDSSGLRRALAEVPAGSTIALAPGAYEGPFEVPRSVCVEGPPLRSDGSASAEVAFEAYRHPAAFEVAEGASLTLRRVAVGNRRCDPRTGRVYPTAPDAPAAAARLRGGVLALEAAPLRDQVGAFQTPLGPTVRAALALRPSTVVALDRTQGDRAPTTEGLAGPACAAPRPHPGPREPTAAQQARERDEAVARIRAAFALTWPKSAGQAPHARARLLCKVHRERGIL